MHWLDWIVFTAFIIYVVWDGLSKASKSKSNEDYFLASRSMPWWAIWLSIMATQASAITMVGTTGQGWADGLKFAQFYFSLPIAMVIIALWVVPFYQRQGVYTVYEFIASRLGQKTRLLSSFAFIILRGLSLGIVIQAPAGVFAQVFGTSENVIILALGGIAVLYASLGGIRAVMSTDVKQMTVMCFGLIVIFCFLLMSVQSELGIAKALSLAKVTGHSEWLNWSWDPSEKYTIWSSLIGGTFLFLSYFAADQSQVQRYLTGRSLKEIQKALYLNALCKIPFQFLVLSCGLLIYIFFLYVQPPVSFIEGVRQQVSQAEESGEKNELTQAATKVRQQWQEMNLQVGQLDSAELSEAESAAYLTAFDSYRDSRKQLHEQFSDSHKKGEVNYVFPYYITHYLPMGLVGLLLAAIIAAALSSIDSELNSMTTVAMLDGWNAMRGKTKPSEQSLNANHKRAASLFIGAFACLCAIYLRGEGSLVERVNYVGSLFYGPLLGLLILAILKSKLADIVVCIGFLFALGCVAVAKYEEVAFLYLNAIGVLSLLLFAAFVSLFAPKATTT